MKRHLKILVFLMLCYLKVNAQEIPPLPQYFSIAYFENFINKSPEKIKDVFKDGPFHYMSRDELKIKGFYDHYDKGILTFIKVDPYGRDYYYIDVSFNEPNYNKCSVITYKSHIIRFNAHKQELIDQGYELIDDYTGNGRRQFIFQKTGRMVAITIAPKNEMIVVLGVRSSK